MDLLFIIILALLVLISISIAEVYSSIPLIEIKRRARKGDRLSKALYKVALYKFTSQFILWLTASIASAGFFVLVARRSPAWVALCVDLILIWVGYIWIPRSSINIISKYIAQILASPLAWLLRYIHPTINSIHKLLSKKSHVKHTGLYESSDIVKFLAKQKHQTDNRVENFELDMLERVVEFNKLSVGDIMVVKRKVRLISADEKLSPVILDELYKTGHLYFPVYDTKQSNIIGVLNIFDVVENKSTPVVSSVMDRRISYVHENQNLNALLMTIISTRQQFFIVINPKQEFIGIVTTKDALVALVGNDMSGAFSEHDSKQAVAEHFGHHVISEQENVPKATTEVIE